MFLFTLRYRLSTGWVTIQAWESRVDEYGHSHTLLDTRMIFRPTGKQSSVVFNKGDTWCGIPSHQSIDGDNAKECVTSLFTMKPGDTDDDYFAAYTPEQLEWVEANAEELGMLKEERYGEP
jgi:hypothetical protein